MTEATIPPDERFDITTLDALEALFEAPREASIVKEIDHIDANYRRMIEASPFLVLATSGPGGVDCSPRGDPAGFVVVLDERTLVIPDRRGNNRLDSLRNVVCDPRVGLLFMIPGIAETLRVNGRAKVSGDPALLASLVVDGKVPKVAIVVTVETAYFQCSRAIVRARLWEADARVERSRVPTAGEILAGVTAQRIDGDAYDRELPARVKATLY